MNKLILAALALTASGAALAQNSGTPAIDARGIPVVIVSRPLLPNGLATVPTAAEALAWLEAHAETRRSE